MGENSQPEQFANVIVFKKMQSQAGVVQRWVTIPKGLTCSGYICLLASRMPLFDCISRKDYHG
ncbi:MAG: hypothetical protein ACK5GX_01125 [Bacteroidota bacterium]|jgi:hypothetical protein